VKCLESTYCCNISILHIHRGISIGQLIIASRRKVRENDRYNKDPSQRKNMHAIDLLILTNVPAKTTKSFTARTDLKVLMNDLVMVVSLAKSEHNLGGGADVGLRYSNSAFPSGELYCT
jgi:hypothetical protein